MSLDFVLETSVTVSGLIPVRKYRSKDTGLTVVVAEVDGPLVNGYFCLATEAFDDDGLPHTLEHLVFMGSEEYPFKGMLDLFANRCLSQGTNAWTDTDHTCYTMTTAGTEGFLQLLPVYLDHVLYPTLTEFAYHTEVHHVNGEGEDAGVVYGEMQARENTHSSLTHLNFLRNIYPGHCGYKSETGGIMKNLRESCSHKKVCDYHREFYRPDNLCLIVTGKIDPEQIFKAIQPFLQKVVSKGALPTMERPWSTPVPPLTEESVELTVPFPTDDEETGVVMIGWRGPNVLDLYSVAGLKILFRYLTESPIAPLQRELVEIDDPFCADISYLEFENRETAYCIELDDVSREHLHSIKQNVLDVLKNITEGKEQFDMQRMDGLIQKAILEKMNAMEDDPHDALAMYAIGDFLFSQTKEGLKEYVDFVQRLKQLKLEASEYWVNLLRRFIVDQKAVVCIGEPNEELMERMGVEEKERVQQRVQRMGVEGLQQAKDKLEEANKQNEKEPPSEIISQMSVPSTASINFHEMRVYSNNESHQKFPLDDMTCNFNVYDVKSLFTTILLFIDTTNLDDEFRLLLPLYSELLFESPIAKDGEVVPYEDVVKQLEKDSLDHSAGIGFHGGRFNTGSYSSLFTLNIKVENEKYATGVTWLYDVLYNLQFTAERIKCVSNKIINSVASSKRCGGTVMKTLLKDSMFEKGNNISVNNMVLQHQLLTDWLKILDEKPQELLERLERFRCCLLAGSLRVNVISNVEQLPPQPHLPWLNTFFKHNDRAACNQIPKDVTFKRAQLTSKKAVGVGSVESAFFAQTCPGINSYEHPDYPSILVFIEYMTACEGPLWRLIRGLGLSYNYRMSIHPTTSTLTYVLTRSTHIFDAYTKSKQIIEGYASGETAFDHSQLEAARSGAIFQTVEGETTVYDAVTQAIATEFKSTRRSFNRDLIAKLAAVSMEDLSRVGKTYFSKLFVPSETTSVLCCNPSKVEDVVKSFKVIGVEMDIIENLDEEILKSYS